MPVTTRLLELQETDTAIDRLRTRVRALEDGEAVAAARAVADDAEAALGELRLSIDELDRDQKKLEHEVDSLAQKAEAEERRLFDGTIANAKELSSLQHEVDNLKRRKADREDELLALMEIRESRDTEAAAAASIAEERRAEADRVVASCADELVVVRAELGEREAARAAIAPAIDEDILTLYESLRRSKKGVGAAALVEGVCQGCHERLSAVVLDELKRTDGVKRCEYCRRILVT
jgi:predicted  nucleic acid-binding Zn-ribbon protein